MVLDGSVRENETAQITADPVRNRLVIQPNHEAEVEFLADEDTDIDEDEDEAAEMEIEEMD